MSPTSVIDLAATCVNSLEQLIDFFIAHLLTEICQDYIEKKEAPN